MKKASFVAPESNGLSCASAVKCPYIYSHPLNELQEQITVLERGKFWFYPLNGEGLEPMLLPWKCYSGHSMERCDESNNCKTFFSSIRKNSSDILHFLWFYIILRPHWHHKSPTLYKSKPWLTQQASAAVFSKWVVGRRIQRQLFDLRRLLSLG